MFEAAELALAERDPALPLRTPSLVRRAWLNFSDRSDPVALLGSLMNAGSSNRVTVVYDADPEAAEGRHVHGARVADDATHPHLVAELDRLRELGFLGPAGR